MALLKDVLVSEYKGRLEQINKDLFKDMPSNKKEDILNTMSALRTRILKEDRVKELDKAIKDRQQFLNTKQGQFNIYLVEAKKEGERIQIHRKGGQVKIYNSAGDEIKNEILSKQAVSISGEDYIIDGILKDNNIFISDLLFFENKSYNNEFLFKRKLALENFNWNENIKENEYMVVDNKQLLQRACEMLSALSPTVLVKNYDSFYDTKGVTDSWFIYSTKEKYALKEIHADLKGLSPILDSLDSFEIIHNFMSIVGSTVKSEAEHQPNDIDIHVRLQKPENDYIRRAVEVRIMKMLPIEITKKIHFIWGDPEGSHDSFCPLYHLALVRAKPEVVKMSQDVELMKPFKPMKSSAVNGLTLFYKIDEAVNKLTPIGKPLIVEEKFDGFHAVLHKKGSKVEIFTEENNNVTDAFPELVNEAKKLSEEDFIIEGELVAHDQTGKTLGRAPLIKYVEAAINNKTLPKDVTGEEIIFHVWDLLYFGNRSLTDAQLYERKKAMNVLDWTKHIQRVDPHVVRNRAELISEIENVSAHEGSEGAMVKRWDSIYKPNSSTSAYVKVKIQQNIYVVVLGEEKASSITSVYKVGIYIPESDANKIYDKRLSKLNDRDILVLGNTFLTSLKFNVGDIIGIAVEEVWRHKQSTTGQTYWSIHKPRVIGKTNKGCSTWEDLDKLAVSGGQSVSFSMLELSDQTPENEGGTREELAIDFWNKNWQDMYPKSGKANFVYQRHWRGLTEEEIKISEEELMKTNRSVHGDFRGGHDSADAWGFTIFLGETQDNPWPDDKLIKLSKTHDQKDVLRGHPKLRIPGEWLDVGKHGPAVSSPGGVGSTSQKYAKFFAADYGTYEIGVWREHFMEMFVNGKALDGRMTISYVPLSGGRLWLIDYPKDQTPYAQSHNKEDIIRELHSKGQKWLVWNDPTMNTQPEKINVEEEYAKLKR